MTSATNTYTQTINLTPYWTENKPNIILIATYYTTSGYSYSASITGPGGIALNFPNNNSGVQTNALELTTPYRPGETLQYLITITSDSPTLSMQVQNSTEIGTKPDGTAITYQGFMFSNDAGGDKDWNDCVITLALFNDSTD